MGYQKYKRTIKVPVHYGVTTLKTAKLNKLTAKLTYCTKLFSDIIKQMGYVSRTKLAPYEKEIAKKTKLSTGYIQQCKDKAIWMWKSYKKEHSRWEFKLKRAKKGTKWHSKLLKRAPSEPFSKSINKIPVRLDSRTVSLKTNLELKGKMVKALKEDLDISSLWLHVSTLKKRDKMMIPLNPAEYHLQVLKDAIKISDCELIKRNHKWYVHFSCEYQVPVQTMKKLRAIDLGITRTATTVLLIPERNLSKDSFLIIKEGYKKHKLEQYDKLIGKLQRLQKWIALKHIRQKRANFIEDSERKLAEQIANVSSNCLIGIGYPKRLKYGAYKGNNKRKLRQKLQKWAYSRIINYITQSSEEKGIDAIKVNEFGTSKTCSKCGSTNTIRPYQNNWSLFKCMDCNIILNADINGAVNIANSLFEKQVLFNRGALDDQARNVDDFRYHGMSTQPLKTSVGSFTL
ncbi:MAG: transposase [Nanoarchaeota archaeon]|nr:transposase [Nanoarchaeota archaeon]